MAWTWITLALVLAYLLKAWLIKKMARKVPPGPKALPVFGHLHLLGRNPYQDMAKLAQKHGPIMSMRFGFVHNIIVSSPKAAEQFVKTYDHNFANRPFVEAGKNIFFGQKNLSYLPYGPYWRKVRKLCTVELLTNSRMDSFKAMRREEVGLMVDHIKQAANERGVVDLSAKVSSLNADMSCRMLFGKKFEDKDFDERGFEGVIQEAMQVSVAFNLGDYFPFLRVLDLQGLAKRMKAISKIWDQFFNKILDEHEQSMESVEAKDFVDTLLAFMKAGDAEFVIDRSHVKAILLDLISAATDTSATTIEWTLSELLKHPRVMKKVQNELEQVVGMDRMVEETDLDRLEYLDMVIKEAFRLHPVVPLLLPHESIEDCTVDGFFIPKKTRIAINVWAIGRDPKVWTEPDKFLPERFVGSSIDVRGHDFELLPFGSGRRGCPGTQLGLTVVRLAVAQLVHCFDWELPNGMQPSELDMTEEFGLVVARAKHLMASPTYRLHKICSA